MTDQFEEASATEMREREAAVENERARSIRRAAVAAARVNAHGGLPPDCCDCGDPIPSKRRKAVPGCIRCVPCETRRLARERLT